MAEKKEIKVTQEIRVELMKEFPVCEKTIYNALKFETSGYTAESIRRRALELGATLMVESKNEEPAAADFCAECTMREYPPCDKGIPCCRCKDECNSRQLCPAAATVRHTRLA